ncbi:choice-of-anchor M domain-containing protein [Streptomyces sp. MP131-18]|uniref:choice-of-anchor M domain-containing protein n=1 Tax=Streptomyces sp. MP131-18 TaxID=1857892 RepID=UPI00097C9023|nr:choice-of-anchor M domain-containing protein [Streptomyces sp. MP131-18]ONK14632.1 putative ABC transporter-associated repeat protein [Streptomyces sp. MP131-18]
MTTRSRPRWRNAITGFLAAAMAAGALGTAHAADPLVLDHGHIDAFNVSVVDGELVLDLKEDVTGSHVPHAPEDVLLHVKEDAWIDGIPEGYPGAPAGYVLPLTQDQNLIWPGWDTGGVAGSGYTDVEIDISAVDGPGPVYLYTLSGFGTVTPLLEEGDYELPGTLREESPAHTHAQWTFTEPGEYTLTARATATNPGTGESITSNTAAYAFSVGDREAPPPVPSSLSIEGLADHYHTGDAVELTAVPNAATDLDHYHWYTRDSAAGDWEAAEGGDGDRYTGTAEIDGRQIKAELLDADHEVVAESAPVTVHIDDHQGEDPGATTLTVEGTAERYRPGDTAELTAVQTPGTELDHYHWFTRGSAEAEWALAGDAGTGADYTFEVAEEADGLQVQARLYDHDHEAVAASEPVTIRVTADDAPGDTTGSGSGGNGGAAVGSPTGGGATEGGSGNGGSGSGGATGGGEPSCFPVEEEHEVPVEPGRALVLDHGHVDAFNVTAEGDDLVLDLKEDVTGSHVRHAPEDVILHVKPDALAEDIPAEYPGSPAGYLLPLTQDPNLIWPGWDTNGVAGSGYTDVEIAVSAVEGPGSVYLYTTNTFGGVVSLLTEGGHELPGSVREESPAHTHAQWTFAEAGQYTLTVRATATDPDTGESVTSDTETYTFAVGDAPGDLETQGGTTTEMVTVGRTADGEDCELSDDQVAGGNLAGTGSNLPPLLIWISAALMAGGAAAFAINRRRPAAHA